MFPDEAEIDGLEAPQAASASDSFNGEVVELPDLEYSEAFRIGRRICLLEPGREVRVVERIEVKVSPRRKANAMRIDNGDTVVILDKKPTSPIEGVDAVLLTDGRGGLRWHSHTRLEAFTSRLRTEPIAVRDEIEATWEGHFSFRTEVVDGAGRTVEGRQGLRPPQIGALHAIGAHWSIFPYDVSTVVMPTGTGKTETMLCSVVNYRRGPTLVMVPSDALRWQTARKFRSLGLLRKLGLVPYGVSNPIVAVVTKEPTAPGDLDIFDGCTVAIGVMSSMAATSVAAVIPRIAERFSSLFIDEAHHVASQTWSVFRGYFQRHHIVQFTATPFRNDGRLVDGKVIFSYPLAAAQRDGYFKQIRFVPVFELDQESSDKALAREALRALDGDLAEGLNHFLMARCARQNRGDDLLALYKDLAPGRNPILVHSGMSELEVSRRLDELRSGRSRIIVCVNMLGEGFDFPELKIAALHDAHKSLPILLQFTGRFTRTSADAIGDATVVANIADPSISAKLEKLYSEDADWNVLLRDMGSAAAKEHEELLNFLRDSEDYAERADLEDVKFSNSFLRPKFSTVVYRCDKFSPKSFINGLPPYTTVHTAWYNNRANVLYFVARMEKPLKWIRSKRVTDLQWDLYVLWHDQENKLLHVNSSNKDSTHDLIADAVGASLRIQGEDVFRSLGRIQRLVFNNIGVRKHGRRNMSFAMYTGSDVQDALTITEKKDASKSNLDGRGWENGQPVDHGCSAKGRIWTKSQGTIPQFIRWAKPVGDKLIDASIDIAKIIPNVLIPKEIGDSFPNEEILSVEWPPELLKSGDDRIVLAKGEVEVTLAFCDLVVDDERTNATQLAFRIVSDVKPIEESLLLEIDKEKGYRFTCSDQGLTVRAGRSESPVAEFLNDYPLLVRYISLKELEGNLLYEQHDPVELKLDARDLEAWPWTGVDITVESTWKEGVERPQSIQSFVAAHFGDVGFDIIFNDDDAGEAADLICIKEQDDNIHLVLVHCKFSGKRKPGERVKDVVEVASQAVRSAVWRGKFDRLYRHMIERTKVFGSGGPGRDRFIRGDPGTLGRISRLAKQKRIDMDIYVVQPGIMKSALTSDQQLVLAAASTFIRQTIDVQIKVLCSA